MTRSEFKALILGQLKLLDEREQEARAVDPATGSLFIGLFERWQHARAAFPGMGWEEFLLIDQRRKRPARRGRPKASPSAMADTPMFRAARDVDRIKALWRDMNSADSRARPPVPAVEIAAERHGVNEDALADLVRRPASRRHDRAASRP